MPVNQQCVKSILLVSMMTSGAVFASTEASVQACLLEKLQQASDELTVGDLKKLCIADVRVDSIKNSEVLGTTEFADKGAIEARRQRERETQFNQFVLTPHKRNFVLPAYTTNNVNLAAYESIEGYGERLEDVETQFQVSLKVPLNQESLFFEGDALYMGFTLNAWWQVYAGELSRLFRETNYQPELFYLTPTSYQLFGGDTFFVVGLEHQSNGRSQLLSRSWNRLYTNFVWEKDNLVLSLRPWYRLQEDDKAFPLDPEGDDNPDINEFMGRFEFGGAYQWNDFEFNFLTRQNFATHNGAIEVGVSFPLYGKFRGYAKGFTGYGDSLIDYNHKQTRFGIGITINDLLFKN